MSATNNMLKILQKCKCTNCEVEEATGAECGPRYSKRLVHAAHLND